MYNKSDITLAIDLARKGKTDKQIMKYLNGNTIKKENKVIVNEICNHFELKQNQLKAKTRNPKVILARSFAYLFLRTENRVSLHEIGRMFDRTHATVLSSLKTIRGRIAMEKQIDEMFNTLKEKI